MTAIQETASVHPKTIQLVARGEHDLPRSLPRPRRVHPNQVSYLQVHPLVLHEAKRIISEGTYTRIQIIDDRTVIVS